MMSEQLITFDIRKADIQTIAHLCEQLPEFVDPPQVQDLHARLDSVPHLILVAYTAEKAVAFKVGYARDDHFYSWLGGVVPAFRRKGLARSLAERQEKWAKSEGYQSIVFKTRNQHKNMLIFALNHGFDIIGFTEKEEVSTNRILLRKVL